MSDCSKVLNPCNLLHCCLTHPHHPSIRTSYVRGPFLVGNDQKERKRVSLGVSCVSWLARKVSGNRLCLITSYFESSSLRFTQVTLRDTVTDAYEILGLTLHPGSSSAKIRDILILALNRTEYPRHHGNQYLPSETVSKPKLYIENAHSRIALALHITYDFSGIRHK